MVIRRLIGRIRNALNPQEVEIRPPNTLEEKEAALILVKNRLGKVAHSSASSLRETDPIYVAVKGSKVVGSLFLMQTGTQLDGTYLAMSKWHEGQGIARRLVEKTFEHAHKHNVTQVTFRAKKSLMPMYLRIARENRLHVEESKGLFHFFGKIKL